MHVDIAYDDCNDYLHLPATGRFPIRHYCPRQSSDFSIFVFFSYSLLLFSFSNLLLKRTYRRVPTAPVLFVHR